ncbi:amino acid ABC transporter ATP-binding protein [Benzoatithermus flavus]|uniref:amino acid ABC transporter ATP-binding protein n=1 Tax=Benzoatithermus flavus TaxID=3108223 RepID=UPI003AB02D2B
MMTDPTSFPLLSTHPTSSPLSGVDPASPPLLSIANLHKGYGPDIRILKGLDIDMKPGERLVVIGPSGGGKSTLLRVVMGLEQIDGGIITFGGKRYIAAEQPGRTFIDVKIRREIGMVFQHYTLFPHLNVLQNLILAPCKVRGEAKSAASARAMALLARFGLEAKAKAYPAQLSGGQKQRVAIARALMLDPKLLLFDEVTSALDPELVAEVEQVILQIANQGMPMMIVTHDMWFAKNIASRVVFCAGGVVVEDGPPEQVLGSPREERTREFINRVFHIQP